MKKALIVGMALSFMVGVLACGGDDETTPTTSSIALTTIDQLPRATGPVVDSATGSLSQALTIKAATTGLALGDATEDDFTATSSIAMCESTNLMKEAMRAAAQADLILCFIQNMDFETDIDDGNFHFFSVDTSSVDGGDEEEGGPDNVKMKVSKDANGNITQFELFACTDGSQTEYIKQGISGSTMTMVSKGVHGGSDGSGRHQVNVTGALNSDGLYTSKDITIQHIWESGDSSYSGSGKAVVNQGFGSFWANGFNTGSYTEGGQAGSYTNRAYAEGQLIDGNTSTAHDDYNIGLLAIGDGAGYGIFSNTGSFEGTDYEFSTSNSQGWNGDTTAIDTTSSYYDRVNSSATRDEIAADIGLTVPLETETISITFDASEGESYACNGTIEETVVPPATLETVTCARLFLSHEWINCYEKVLAGAEQQVEVPCVTNVCDFRTLAPAQVVNCTQDAQCSGAIPNGVCRTLESTQFCTLACNTSADCASLMQ